MKISEFIRIVAINLAVGALLLAVSLLVVEGAAVLLRGSRAKTSLTTRALNRLTGKESATAESAHDNDFKPPEFLGDRYIIRAEQIEELLPALRRAKAIMGNTPFKELATPEAQVTYIDPEQGKCLKPNLHFKTWFLRSLIFSPHEMPTLMMRVDSPGTSDPKIQDFLAKYGFGQAECHTDENGDRVTVPTSDRNEIVLVLGDSVAMGVMLPDDKTLASCLQQTRDDARYLTSGVPSCDGRDSRKRLARRLGIYGDRIRGVIYLHSTNDLKEPPEDIVNKLADILDQHKIGYRVFVHQDQFFTTFPELLRQKVRLKDAETRRLILRLAAERGFAVITFEDMVQDFQKSEGSLYAALALYIDHGHLSPRGIRMLADRVPQFARKQAGR